MNKLFCILILLLLSSCHIGRFVSKNYANITDHKIFPYTEIESVADESPFKVNLEEKIASLTFNTEKGDLNLKKYLQEYTRSTAFLVVQKGEIKFEEYFRGYSKEDISNIFSVSKSITSLLVGIALKDGLIEDIQDPITKYLPEFKSASEDFEKLTIDHLLQMRTGLKYTESYGSPFAHMAKLYYGLNQERQLRNLSFDTEPGSEYEYQSAATALLGMIVERVSGMELGDYLEEMVWKPMKMEHDATWSVDDKRNRSTKAYCCLNTTARDLAMIGQLYLNMGQWEGKEIVSESWVAASIRGDLSNGCYQKQWYNLVGRASGPEGPYAFDSEKDAIQKAAEKGLVNYEVKFDELKSKYFLNVCLEDFYAQGILGQYLYVNPKSETIVIRLGEKRDISYFPIMRKIAKVLGEASS